MKPILLLLLASMAVCACTLLFFVMRARNRRLLLNALRPAYSDAPDSIGISVLCSGVSDPAQIENLLSSEYARYEVVVVLDARCRPMEFAALVARYRLIRVEWVCTGELEVEGVRALGRSRKRRFRRLVLVDRASDGPAGDFDAAASVSTYDYLLPVRAGQYLLPGAVERLVAELGGEPSGTLDAVRSCLCEPALLLSREAVVAAGGFGRHPLGSIPRGRRRMLWEPLLTVRGRRRAIPGPVRAAAGVLLVAAVVAAAAAGWWMLAAVLVTGALVWSAAACVALLAEEMAPEAASILAVWRRAFRP